MNRILLYISLIVSFNIAAVSSSYAEEITKQQAAAIAQSKHPGRVIDVKNSENSYRVKVLDKKGGMHIVIVDKQTGNEKSEN